MAKKNPFNQLLNIMDERSEKRINELQVFYIGTVTSPFPNLKVKTCGIELDKDNLMIDKWLLDRNVNYFETEDDTHTHTITVDTHTASATDNTHNHKIKDNINNKIEIGDKLVLLRMGDTFFILSKVVSF